VGPRAEHGYGGENFTVNILYCAFCVPGYFCEYWREILEYLNPI
jgi:hypothetical protein